MFYGGGSYGSRGGRGRRNMYNLTGLPGWRRGMGGGGPCAQYLLTGSWPASPTQAAGQMTQPARSPVFAEAPVDKTVQLDLLRKQEDTLKQQLEQLQTRINELNKENKNA